jgi:hypothetical protein
VEARKKILDGLKYTWNKKVDSVLSFRLETDLKTGQETYLLRTWLVCIYIPAAEMKHGAKKNHQKESECKYSGFICIA